MLTYDGLRAAEAKGDKGGRCPAIPAAKTADVHTASLEGHSIAALVRDHRVSCGAIRTAVADLLPDHTASHEDAPPRGCRSRSTCRARSTITSAPPSWSPPSAPRSTRGRPCSAARATPCASAPPPAVHRQLLARCQPLGGAQGVPAVAAQSKARREYENRVSALTP
ncbi:resolvase [Streptomyces nojiriensis]|uniref:resolvase n=1 Tax=Streptomyces nojiriensis TaxID=66374 RepID=UPI00366390DB